MTVEDRVGIADNHRVAPAVLNGQHRVVGDFTLKAGTASAQDTTFLIQHNQVTQRVALGGVMLAVIVKAADPRTMPVGKVLQRTLAALVAYGTVQGMAGQQELQYCFAVGGYLLAIGDDDHALGHGHGARSLWLGEPTDERLPLVIELGLAGSAVHQRRADGHQTHAAHAHRLQLGVVAKDGDLNIYLLGRFDDECSLGNGYLAAVNGQTDTLHYLSFSNSIKLVSRARHTSPCLRIWQETYGPTFAITILILEMLDTAAHRRNREVTQQAEAVAVHLVGDIEEQVHVPIPAVTTA